VFDPPGESFNHCAVCSFELYGADYSRLACRRCEDRMYRQLNEVLDLWLRLPSATYRRIGERAVGRAVAVHAGIPGNGTVIALTGPGDDTPAGRLLAVEDDWRRARLLPAREVTGRPEATLRTAVRFLRGHLPWACGAHLNPPMLDDGTPLLPDVAGLATALDRTVRELEGAIGQASSGEPRPRTILVTCLAEYDDGTPCGEPLRVGATDLCRTCPSCKAKWTREAYMQIAKEIGYFGLEQAA
jgi:hypothetical protein